MSAESLMTRLRQQLAAAQNLTEAGDLGGANAKCQEASDTVLQLTHLCHGRPQLQSEAAPLFGALKQIVAKLQRLQSGQRKSSPSDRGSNGGQPDPSEAFMDDNPFSERNVLMSFQAEQQKLKEMQSREAAMDHLAKDMIALEEIFSDLNKLVNEQGEQLQLIEDHVVEVEEAVTKGEEQLAEAVRQKRCSRKKKIIIIVVVVAAVLVLTLILYFVLSRLL